MKKFQVTSGAMVCSDPCYTTDVWCMSTVNNVKNGTWAAEVDTVESYGHRISELRVKHIDADTNGSKWEMLTGDFGVDSGQFGFFDSVHYRKAASVKGVPLYDFGGDFLTDNSDRDGDIWYRACCNLTLGKDSWGVIPHGAVSSSGYGDSSYGVAALKDVNGQYIAFQVIFIGEEEDEDEDEFLDEDEVDQFL